MAGDFESRIRNVTAVLGPTNTGKTHLAIERMLGHDSGMIGLPLRLLAREVYDKIAARVGADKVALITGEEKIKPERARYWVATVEAMPRDVDVDYLAIDEIQLAGDPERGHVFTDRLLHARGKSETFLLGAQTMRDAISDLIPGANFISRPRLSKLTYAGEKKITRLPARTAVIAFSASEVYAIAELIRRQRGGTAVVLGALSPRTRNAQVELYQSGDVEFLVATDAIGMGLNLNVDHVAFSNTRKFDGQNHRNLTPGELGQIAGRAGRYMNDGTFGVTGSAEPLDSDTIERLENHTFDSVRTLQWRNRKLDFASLDRLRDSLREMPGESRLVRARMADDVAALETIASDREIADLASNPAAVMRLWDVCQIPDYRKISSQNHSELVATIFKFLQGPEGRVPEDWFAKQVAFADRTDGDIDTLANRIAHIRTWTFVSNRADWLKDPEHWQQRTRQIEDNLSDALHECLTQRFVDRRTSALMKGMRDKEELNAEIGEDGAINVENHFVGRLKGFRFVPDTQAEGIHGKATRHAAAQVLSRELAMRARRVAAAKSDAFKLTRSGRIIWHGEEIAHLEAGENALKPAVSLVVDEHLSQADKDKVQARLETWIGEHIGDKLKPLVDVTKATDVSGLARGIAFRLGESFGILKRESIAEEIKSLDQNARAQLRKYGVRFGAFNIYFPLLLKPAAAELALTLWGLKHAAVHGLSPETLPEPPRPGLTSVATDAKIPEAFYRACGFHSSGPRAVRIDMLERLADVIRPLLAWRKPAEGEAIPPKGATGDGGFTVTPEMMSLLGCSTEELGSVLRALGFRLDRRPIKSEAPAESASAAATDVALTAKAGSAAELVGAAGDSPAPEVIAVAETAATPLAVEKSAEQKFEDIWRPRRHHKAEGHSGHHGKNRGRRHREQQHGRSAHAPAGDAAGPATPAAATGTSVAAAEASSPPPAGDGERRPHRRWDRKQEGKDRGRDRKPADREHGHRDRNDRGRGPDRHRGDRRREDRPAEVRYAAPPKKGPDPDSPFAALGALREALEKQGKEKSTT
jgi:ATP-dependent RNA helicase SUPV3L1/SUV3